MTIKTYARIAQNTVVELFATNGDIGAMFHCDLRWVDVTDIMEIAYGWSFDGTRFAQPGLVAAEPEARTRSGPDVRQPVLPACWEAEQSAG